MYVRLDRQLGALFAYIDSTIGLANSVITLTGDHGVSPLPEKFPGEARRVNARDFFSTLRTRIGQEYGYDEGKEHLLMSFMNDEVYLDYDPIKAHGFDPQKFERSVGETAMGEPGVVRYFTRTELLKSIAEGGSSDHDQSCIEHSFYPPRSGGVVILLRPHWFFGGRTGTTHGTPYEYDTHVPFLAAGQGIRQGRYASACSPNDISATLAKLLGLPKPQNCAGTARTEALK